MTQNHPMYRKIAEALRHHRAKQVFQSLSAVERLILTLDTMKFNKARRS